MNKEKDDCESRISIRLDDEIKKMIKVQAELENTTTSELIRTAISWYLHKDVNYKSQLEATIESLRREMKKMSREVELNSSLFKFWTQYYFTLTKDLSELEDNSRKQRIDLGKEQTEKMLRAFRGQIKEIKPGLIEALVADYLLTEK